MDAVSKKKQEPTDFLLWELDRPISFEGSEIKEMDLRKLRDMTLDELTEVSEIYSALGGNEAVFQEVSLKFAKVIANKVSGLPLEAIGKMGAKDAVRLKTRVYRFFYL